MKKSAKGSTRQDTPKDTQHRRKLLYSLMGDLPDRHRPIKVELIAKEERESYFLEKLILDLNGIEMVPAYYVHPKTGNGPWPAMLYNHWHGGDYESGKAELLTGRNALQRPAFGEQLVQLGYSALCIDHWAFGDRHGRRESEIFKNMLWHGQVMWGMMVYDSIRAVDYLISRPDVQAGRIGTMGISMGSTMAWWLAALDERIKVCIDLCCLTDFHTLIKARGLDGHGLYYYVPGLLKHFTTAQINALIAPRPHLALAGNYDHLTPPAGLDVIDAELRKAYARAGAPDAWKLLRYDISHYETALMRKKIVEWLQKWM